MIQPYISFVTAVRNDEYADPQYRKLKLNVTILSQQCIEHRLPAEIIFVEWNPDLSKPSIAEILSEAVLDTSWLTVRVITVPPIFHKQWKLHELRPMHPTVAINIGLRRARGQFCLLKTQDTFYDPNLVAWLARQELETNKIYRTVRVDVSPDILEKPFVNKEEFLLLCKENIIGRNDPLPLCDKRYYELPVLFTNACGDFQLMARHHFFDIRGYLETKDVRAYETDSLLSFAAYGHNIEQVILPSSQCVYKITHFLMHPFRCESPYTALPLRERFFLKLESLKWISKFSFFMRAVFNYPKKFYYRKPVHSYERSLCIYKFLTLFPWLVRLQKNKWGYAGEKFEDVYLRTAQWENTYERR